MSKSVSIRGGTIVDGTGQAQFRGDVLIRDGRIAAVGQLDERADKQLDASGMIVAPGIIDVHTHYDATVFWDPLVTSSSQYGVTTVVMGNCGIGLAPVQPDGVEYLIQLLARVEGMPVRALTDGVPWNWGDFGSYLDAVDQPLGLNVISLVGHAPLRHSVMGAASYERAATAEEIARMQQGLRSGLERGAWGFSSSAAPTHNDLAGRPTPSRLAGRSEFEGLADVVGEFHFGIIGMSPGSKLRGLSQEDRSLLQMLSLRGGASVNWNPLIYSPEIPDLWQVNLSASEEAAAVGARVYAVSSPSSMGGMRIDLQTMIRLDALPRWKPLAQMSADEKIRVLSDPEHRVLLAADLADDASNGLLTTSLRKTLRNLRVNQVYAAENEPYLGRLVGEIALESGRTPMEVVLDIGIADGLRTMFMEQIVREEDEDSNAAHRAIAKSPYVLYGGTDAGAHVDILAHESLWIETLRWRVLEDGSLGLEELIRRNSSAIADAIGLAGRGRLVPGQAADVVVFDLDQIDAGDAYLAHDLPGGGERMMTDPHGVRYTLAGGEVTFDDGKPTGALPGRVLRSSEHCVG